MKRKIPAIVWLLIIVVISGFPGDQVPSIPVWQFDKLVHSFIYMVLTWVLLFAFNEQYSMASKRFLLGLAVILFGISFGGFMEILQAHIFINRSGNWYDFFANGFGAILGLYSYPFIKKLLPKTS